MNSPSIIILEEIKWGRYKTRNRTESIGARAS